MPRFIIHIGYGKTGTTALQSFLKANRTVLAHNGFLYPDFRHWGVPLDIADHNIVGNALAGQPGWLKFPVEKYFAKISAQTAKRSDIHTVLMSAETFLGKPQPYFFHDEVDYWAACEKKIKKLKEMLDGQTCLFIIYVRRQDEWLEASLNQTIKFEGFFQHPPDTSVEGYIHAYAPRLDYHRQATLWASHFGREAIKVAIYDRQLLKNGDIVADFIDLAGLPVDDNYIKPVEDASISNVRLCRDVLEFKRIYNRIPRGKEDERALARDLRIISSDMIAASGITDPPLLSWQQRQELLDRYAPSNERLIADFMSGSPVALAALTHAQISPGEKDSSETIYSGLGVDKMIEVLHRLEERHIFHGEEVRLLKFTHILRKHFPVIHALARFICNYLRVSYV